LDSRPKLGTLVHVAATPGDAAKITLPIPVTQTVLKEGLPF
jgi:hypothetical protein